MTSSKTFYHQPNRQPKLDLQSGGSLCEMKVMMRTTDWWWWLSIEAAVSGGGAPHNWVANGNVPHINRVHPTAGTAGESSQVVMTTSQFKIVFVSTWQTYSIHHHSSLINVTFLFWPSLQVGPVQPRAAPLCCPRCLGGEPVSVGLCVRVRLEDV